MTPVNDNKRARAAALRRLADKLAAVVEADGGEVELEDYEVPLVAAALRKLAEQDDVEPLVRQWMLAAAARLAGESPH